MAPGNHLAHDERGPSIRQNFRGARNGTELLVLLHGASLHGRIAGASSKIEPAQSVDCTSAAVDPLLYSVAEVGAMSRRHVACGALALSAAILVGSAVERADAVLDWNAIALTPT